MNNEIETCSCGCFVFDAEAKKCVKCGTERNNKKQDNLHKGESVPIFTPEKEIEIQKYIEKMGFTWTVCSIREAYKEYKKGHYVSFTARQIINNVIEKP